MKELLIIVNEKNVVSIGRCAKSLQTNPQKYVDKNEIICYNIFILDNDLAWVAGSVLLSVYV